MNDAPHIDLASRIELLLPQYEDAARLRALITGAIGIEEAQVSEVLERLDRGGNPEESSGPLLDWMGHRLGIQRPIVSTGEYLGYEGTDPEGGNPFNQEEYYDDLPAINQVAPLSDEVFRPILKARARRLRGGADRETIEAILELLFPDGGGYVDESSAISDGTSAVQLVVSAEDNTLYRLVSDDLFHLLIPRPAGVAVEFMRSDP
ncbi:MAG: DUF2612 domain-containing protein [Gemmatimonadetes bacterium]|nr:DUF2612 domain-containing protein [Gemmatimonadota bacterium]